MLTATRWVAITETTASAAATMKTMAVVTAATITFRAVIPVPFLDLFVTVRAGGGLLRPALRLAVTIRWRRYVACVDGIPETGWARLSYYIDVRLAQLRWSLEDLAAAGGPAPGTLYKARRQGRPLRARTATRLEAALGWPVGSVPRVLSGGTPESPLSAPPQARVGDVAAELAASSGVSAAHRELLIKEVLLAVATVLNIPQAGPDDPGREVADAHAS